MTDPRAELNRSLTSALASAQARPKPKRFYTSADVTAVDGSGWQLMLDGRPAKTPKKRPLAVETETIARALAAEWAAQTTEIDPSTMPLTTLACTAIDTVSERAAAVADEVAAYAMSDLLCYRAESPEALNARQSGLWDPVIAWAQSTYGVRWQVTTGLMPVAQDERARVAVREAIATLKPLPLSGLHVLTTMSGSALLALAYARQRLSLDELWMAAHVDEDWQIELWGADAEAQARRTHRRRDAEAAALALRAG